MSMRKRFERIRTWFPPSQMSRPTEKPVVAAPQCAFCSQRAATRCEYPECNLPLCPRCRIRKGGGNLCRRHKDARLVQVVGRPAPDAVPIAAVQLERFKAKGPAVPHF